MQNFTVMPTYTYIQTHLQTKYILKCVSGFDPLGLRLIFFFFFFFFFFLWHYFTLRTNGKRRSQEEFHLCYSQSQIAYAYHVLSLLLQGFVWSKYLFWPFLGPDMETEMGVVIYMHLKNRPDYIDSKYILVHGSNCLGSSVLAEIQFLAFLVYHSKSKRCGQVGPSPFYSQGEVIHAYQLLDL